MRMENASQHFFDRLQQRIEKAEIENKPIHGMVRQQIKILEDAHDEFIKNAQKDGYSLNNPKVGEIEVRQYSAMRELAQKIGLPVDKYDKMIKDVRIRIFGEENYKRFFEEQK